MTAAAGFIFAAEGQFDFGLFAAAIVGLALVMGSACVFNNYLDRGIDAKMERTAKRALVTHKIRPLSALCYGLILSTAGFLYLAVWTNWYAFSFALLGFVVYIAVYGWFKRHSVHGTLVGSIAGAVPPVVGYCAVSGRLDANTWLLFTVLVVWQMPHFYAIAIYRLKDYKSAGLPILPAVKGLAETRKQIIAYILAFIVACIGLSVFGTAGYSFAIVLAVCGGWWLKRALTPLAAKTSVQWGRQLFKQSLWVLMILSIMLSVNWLLP